MSRSMGFSRPSAASRNVDSTHNVLPENPNSYEPQRPRTNGNRANQRRNFSVEGPPPTPRNPLMRDPDLPAEHTGPEYRLDKRRTLPPQGSAFAYQPRSVPVPQPDSASNIFFDNAGNKRSPAPSTKNASSFFNVDDTETNREQHEQMKRENLATSELREGSDVETTPYVNFEPLLSWIDTRLDHRLRHVIQDRKYKPPTKIQQVVIPLIMKTNRHIKCQSETGTGKTEAFLLPIINEILVSKVASCNYYPYALIIEPSRDAVDQVYFEATSLGERLGIATFKIHGGTVYPTMPKGCDITCGTPQTIINFYRRNKLLLQQLRYVVVDEVDKLLARNNQEKDTFLELIKITEQINPRFITVSATLSELKIRILQNAIVARSISMSNELVDYKILVTKNSYADRCSLLEQCVKKIRNEDKDSKILILMSNRDNVDEVCAKLTMNGFPSIQLHGMQDNAMRTEAMENFRWGSNNILVATPVVGRTSDIIGLNYVINFDIRKRMSKSDFIQYGGRTGRFQRGAYITFYSPVDTPLGRMIQQVISEAGQNPPEFLKDRILHINSLEHTKSELNRPWTYEKVQNARRQPKDDHRAGPSNANDNEYYNEFDV